MGNLVLEYSIQLAMLKKLFNHGMVTEKEYEKIKVKLMKDYGVVSDILA